MYIQETKLTLYSLYPVLVAIQHTATKVHFHVHPGNGKRTLLSVFTTNLQQKFTIVYIQETENWPYTLCTFGLKQQKTIFMYIQETENFIYFLYL